MSRYFFYPLFLVLILWSPFGESAELTVKCTPVDWNKFGLTPPQDMNIAIQSYLVTTESFKEGAAFLDMVNAAEGATTIPIHISSNGEVWMKDKNSRFILTLGSFGYGEPFTVRIFGRDRRGRKNQHEWGECRLIPNPLEFTGPGERKIHVEAIDGEGKSFSFELSGFDPNEKVSIKSRSANEQIEDEVPVNEEGKGIIIVLPGVIGRKGGAFEVTLSSSKMGDKRIRHLWGENAFLSPGKYEKELKEASKELDQENSPSPVETQFAP